MRYIKYIELIICTVISILVSDFIIGICIYMIGLGIYEFFVLKAYFKKKNESISNTNFDF